MAGEAKAIYEDVFGSRNGKVVLGDLADFCHVLATTHEPGCTDLDMAVAEGRRQVWLHMQEYLLMDERDVASAMEVAADVGERIE